MSENLLHGWSEDTSAPFRTFYSPDGMLGITEDEDGGRGWFAVAIDPFDAEAKPIDENFKLLPWDTRPRMYSTALEAQKAILRAFIGKVFPDAGRVRYSNGDEQFVIDLF